MDFVKERKLICDECLLNNNDVCNKGMYLNPETNQLSYVKKEGYKNGCGCYLPSKQKNESTHCPLNKW